MGMDFRLHTPDELDNIAKTNFDRFKELSKYYFENDRDFFESVIVPLIKKYKSYESLPDGSELTNQTINVSDDFNLNNDIPDLLLRELTNDKPDKQIGNKKKIILLSITAITLLLTTLVLFYFLIYNTNYRQGVKYLKDKKYDLALEKFGEIDSNSETFKTIEPAINFTRASKYFEDLNYREATIYYKKINPESEFFNDARIQIDKINSDQNIIYVKGLNHIAANELNDALNELKRIEPLNINYNKAQSKIMYVKGLIEFNLKNYENADTYFKRVEISDEFYNDIVSKQPIISDYLTKKQDLEYDKYYAKALMELSDQIEDQFQLCNDQTFTYLKNTYIPKLIELRSRLNSLSYPSKEKKANLIEFKNSILDWVNSYIEYGESLNKYGYNSNYNSDQMWSNYGYILHSQKDTGEEYHQKILREYKKLQLEYDLN